MDLIYEQSMLPDVPLRQYQQMHQSFHSEYQHHKSSGMQYGRIQKRMLMLHRMEVMYLHRLRSHHELERSQQEHKFYHRHLPSHQRNHLHQ